MSEEPVLLVERNVARCRILLGVVAIVAVYVDPTSPTLTRWMSLTGGAFSINPYAFGVMCAHLLYALAVNEWVRRALVVTPEALRWTVGADIGFATLIALFTEGATSPFYAFFAFAVLTVGFRDGLRPALWSTGIGVALYLCMIVVAEPGTNNILIMRPAYLAITGYLAGFFGQQRMHLEASVRALEANAERQRIARSLHDGYAQSLAGINLRVETCLRLLQLQDPMRAANELADLQVGVRREFDELRAYIRTLTERDTSAHGLGRPAALHCEVDARFAGPLPLVEHVLLIALEGLRNAQRHARAHRAEVHVTQADDGVRMDIRDDGRGFPTTQEPPWSIASRVRDLDGRVSIVPSPTTGGHLEVRLPAA